MDLIYAAILGVVQGLTEFLPVSSSGHLVLFQKFLDFNSPGIILEVVLHAGTVLAIIYFYRSELLKLSGKYLVLIVIGTIPAGLVGIIFKDNIEALFNSITLVAAALIVTGVFNYLSDKQQTAKCKLTPANAFLIGVFQALAIVPGISRSGATIFAALLLKTKREEAAKFSFLLSVPAVIGANFLELISFDSRILVSPAELTAGFLFAFITGVLAIRLMVDFVKSKSLKVFSYYTIFLGLLLLIIKVISA